MVNLKKKKVFILFMALYTIANCKNQSAILRLFKKWNVFFFHSLFVERANKER